MVISYQEVAGNKLSEYVGKYIAIHHKYNMGTNNTYSQDVCVVKVLDVTKSKLMSSQTIKVQFCDGRSANLTYTSEYKGHLILHWDYKKSGFRFNDMFIASDENGWSYTYPDITNEDAQLDYFLTTGDLFVAFFQNEEESKDSIVMYNYALQEAAKKREEEKINRANRLASSIANTPQIPTTDLDHLFFKGA